MADLLNNYFASVFTVESNLSDYVTPPSDCFIDDVDFSVAVIARKLEGLNVNKSPGPNGLHPSILHNCSGVLALPLSILFSKLFTHSFVPSDWKIANVIPIFKKGEHSSACNYRPVSLTSVVCKVMESDQGCCT